MIRILLQLPVLLFLLIGSKLCADLVSTQTVYYGMCDASAAVALSSDLFAVANDEDNALRIYRAHEGGSPVQTFDLSSTLKVDPKKPETDLEGACWLSDRIFWISSHGRNREGEFRWSRHRFFATTLEKTTNGFRLVPVGRIYARLLSDLLAERRFHSFDLGTASRLPPKAPGGLNIEGLCPNEHGQLLIGFRNPIPRGRALLIPLLNPNEVLTGQSARFGDPILLNLGGHGVREIAFWQNRYLIVAGSHDGRGKSRLYQWEGGKHEPVEIPDVDLKDFNAEALIVHPGNHWPVQLLSDDGTVIIQGVGCKSLKTSALKRFRGVCVNLPRPE